MKVNERNLQNYLSVRDGTGRESIFPLEEALIVN